MRIMRVVPTADLSAALGMSAGDRHPALACIYYGIKIKGTRGWVHA
jgi:F0F1-type ATP synthase membrane subunit a